MVIGPKGMPSIECSPERQIHVINHGLNNLTWISRKFSKLIFPKMTFDISRHHSNMFFLQSSLYQKMANQFSCQTQKQPWEKKKKRSSLTFLLFKTFNAIFKITLHLQYYKILVIFSVLYNLQHVLHPVVEHPPFPHFYTALPHHWYFQCISKCQLAQTTIITFGLLPSLLLSLLFPQSSQSCLLLGKPVMFLLKKEEFSPMILSHSKEKINK